MIMACTPNDTIITIPEEDSLDSENFKIVNDCLHKLDTDNSHKQVDSEHESVSDDDVMVIKGGQDQKESKLNVESCQQMLQPEDNEEKSINTRPKVINIIIDLINS